MERRLVDPGTIQAIRRAVAVSQTVAQADEVRVTYWLERYAELAGAAEEGAAQSARARHGGERIRKKPDLAEEKISATG
jgi:hypothetical protein